jgi:hypothetical protein
MLSCTKTDHLGACCKFFFILLAITRTATAAATAATDIFCAANAEIPTPDNTGISPRAHQDVSCFQRVGVGQAQSLSTQQVTWLWNQLNLNRIKYVLYASLNYLHFPYFSLILLIEGLPKQSKFSSVKIILQEILQFLICFLIKDPTRNGR